MQTLSDNYMQNVTPVTPADGDDMTWREGYDNAPLTISADGRYIGDTSNPADAWTPLSMVELAKEVRRMQRHNERLQDEVYALAAQVVELREKVQAWEGDS
jgi:hypothetical protein